MEKHKKYGWLPAFSGAILISILVIVLSLLSGLSISRGGKLLVIVGISMVCLFGIILIMQKALNSLKEGGSSNEAQSIYTH